MTPPAGFKVPPASTQTKAFPPDVRHRADVIAHLAEERGWRIGAELGTAEGKTAARVLIRCPDVTLITVDRWAADPKNEGPETWAEWPHGAHEAAARERLARFGRRARIIKADTERAAGMTENASLDFVFIDADHSFAGVLGDIMAWRPKLRPGGALMGHDAAWPGVRMAIDQMCPGYWIGPDDVWGIDV